MAPKAVILLSGGLDSTTLLAHAVRAGYAAHALSFRYGQRHAAELEAAARIARTLGAVEHRTITIDLGGFGGSALTDASIAVPKDRDHASMSTGIPVTYVPARNTVFLSFALAWAEVLDARDVFIGVNALDYSGYPDCRPEFIQAFEQMARLATKMGTEGGQPFTVHTPLIAMTKAEIVKHGLALGVDYATTVSCYEATDAGEACGRCDACQLRRKGFVEAGVSDPTRYAR
jgi:7-cyano-7-deazaguanine synthase